MPTRNCTACGRPMNADLTTCPWCGNGGAVAPPPADTMPCPYCQEPIRRDVTKCRWCGESLTNAPAAPLGAGPGAPAMPPLPPPPPVYGQPPGPVAPPGTTPLVLGIIGLVGCPILAPFAWITGNNYENQCRALGVEPDGAGKAGKILGIIGTVLLLASCGCVGLGFVAGAF